MTDSEIRAAIINLMVKYHIESKEQLSDFVTELQLLTSKALTAERTAIKASLPEKYTKEQIWSMIDCSVGKALVWNEAIDKFTQVIDGREGV